MNGRDKSSSDRIYGFDWRSKRSSDEDSRNLFGRNITAEGNSARTYSSWRRDKAMEDPKYSRSFFGQDQFTTEKEPRRFGSSWRTESFEMKNSDKNSFTVKKEERKFGSSWRNETFADDQRNTASGQNGSKETEKTPHKKPEENLDSKKIPDSSAARDTTDQKEQTVGRLKKNENLESKNIPAGSDQNLTNEKIDQTQLPLWRQKRKNNLDLKNSQDSSGQNVPTEKSDQSQLPLWRQRNKENLDIKNVQDSSGHNAKKGTEGRLLPLWRKKSMENADPKNGQAPNIDDQDTTKRLKGTKYGFHRTLDDKKYLEKRTPNTSDFGSGRGLAAGKQADKASANSEKNTKGKNYKLKKNPNAAGKPNNGASKCPCKNHRKKGKGSSKTGSTNKKGSEEQKNDTKESVNTQSENPKPVSKQQTSKKNRITYLIQTQMYQLLLGRVKLDPDLEFACSVLESLKRLDEQKKFLFKVGIITALQSLIPRGQLYKYLTTKPVPFRPPVFQPAYMRQTFVPTTPATSAIVPPTPTTVPATPAIVPPTPATVPQPSFQTAAMQIGVQ